MYDVPTAWLCTMYIVRVYTYLVHSTHSGLYRGLYIATVYIYILLHDQALAYAVVGSREMHR